MSTATRRVANSPQPGPTTRRNWLAEVSRTAQHRPSAMILYGVPGIGKSSAAAAIPGIVFLIDHAEEGIHRLKESGLVPATVPVLPAIRTWPEALDALETLRTEPHDFKALAVDAMGGFERLCHEEVCRRDYSNDWGKGGFSSYQQGYDTALADWRTFLNALDQLRDERKMSIVLLGHAKVSPFRNPAGPDYDRYNVDVHHKTWALTHKWADMVLFANYEVAFSKGDDTKQKAKAKGGKVRVIYTEHEAAWDAKNRANLPETIEMGNSGTECWNNILAALKAGRKTTQENA